MVRVSKGLFVTVLAGAPAVYFLVFMFAGMSGPGAQEVWVPWKIAATLVVLGGLITALVLFHRMWASIQDGQARMTPGWAVGGLFIPLFQIYHLFQVIWGFARDYNVLAEHRGLRRLSEGLFLACVILYFTSSLCGTFVGLMAIGISTMRTPGPALAVLSVSMMLFLAIWATSYGIWLVVVVKICNAVNGLNESPVPPPSPHLTLYCASGDLAGHSLELTGQSIIAGRSPARAQLVLSSPAVSAVHVQIWPDATQSGLWVKDLESTNGTYYTSNGVHTGPNTWLPLTAPTLLARHAAICLGRPEISESVVLQIR